MSSSFFKRTPAKSATPAPVPVPPEMLQRMVGGRGEGTGDKPDDATLVAHSVLLDHDTHAGHGGADLHASPIKVDPAITKVAPEHQEQASPVKEVIAAGPAPEAVSAAEDLHEPVKAEAEHATQQHEPEADPIEADHGATENLIEAVELHEEADPTSAEEAQLLETWDDEELDALVLEIAETVAEESADLHDLTEVEQAELLGSIEPGGDIMELDAGDLGDGHAPPLDAVSGDAGGHLENETRGDTVVAAATGQADAIDDHAAMPVAAKDGATADNPPDRAESLSDMAIPGLAKQAAAPIARSALFPTQASAGTKMSAGKMGAPTEAQKQAEAVKAAESKAALVTSLETKLKASEGQATTILLKIGEIDTRIQQLSTQYAKQDLKLKELLAGFNTSIAKHADTMREETPIAWKYWEPKVKVFKQALADRDAAGRALDGAKSERVEQLKALQLKAIEVAQGEALVKAAKGPGALAIEPGKAMEAVKKAIADNNQAAQDSKQAREQEAQALRVYDAKLKAFQPHNTWAKLEIHGRTLELAGKRYESDRAMTEISGGMQAIKDAAVAKAIASKLLEADYKRLADPASFARHFAKHVFDQFSNTIKNAAGHALKIVEADKTIIAKNKEITAAKTVLDSKIADAKTVERQIETLKLGSALAIKVKTEALATAMARPGVSDAGFVKLQEAARSGKIIHDFAAKNLHEASAKLKDEQKKLDFARTVVGSHGNIWKAQLAANEAAIPVLQKEVTERYGGAYFAADQTNKIAQAKLAAAIEARAEVKALKDELALAKQLEQRENAYFANGKLPGLEAEHKTLTAKLADVNKRLDGMEHLRPHAKIPLWVERNMVTHKLGEVGGQISDIKALHNKTAANDLAAARAAWEGAAKKVIDTTRAEQLVTARNVDLLSAVQQGLGGTKAGDALTASKDFRDGLKNKVGGTSEGGYNTAIAWKSETGLKPKVTPPGTELSRGEKSGDPAADKARLDAAQQKKAVDDLKGMLQEKGVKLAGSLARDIGQDLAKRMALSAGTAVKVEKEMVLAGTVYRQTSVDGKMTFEAMAQVTMKTEAEAYRSDIGVAASAGFGLTVETGVKLETTQKLAGGAEAKLGGKAYVAAGVEASGSAAANILGVSADVLARAYASGEVSGMAALKHADGTSLEAGGKGQAMTDAAAKAGAKFGADGLSVKASASAEASARAEYSYGIKSEHIDLTTKGEVWAKARAEGTAKAEIGLVGGGFKAGGKLGAEAGAAVGIQETRTVKILGMEVEGTVGAYAGSIGGSASADLSFKDGKLKWSIDIGAALGVGLSLKIGGSIDFAVVLKKAEEVLTKLGEAFGIKPDVSTKAMWVRARHHFGAPAWD